MLATPSNNMRSKGIQGRRSLNAEINLVPFIDLLSMCICFLLMTAVWIQVGSLQIKQMRGTETVPVKSGQYEMDVQFTTSTSLRVKIKKQGSAVKQVSLSSDGFENGLKDLTKIYVFANARVSAKESISYGELVRVLDILRRNNITNIGVVPAGA